MSDIVDRLREIQRMNTTLHGARMAAQAADEIEMLREALKLCVRIHEQMDASFKQVHEVGVLACDKAEEAQRECCRWIAEAKGGTPEEHAQQRGWDCFKEKP